MTLARRALFVLFLCVAAYAAMPAGKPAKSEEIVAFNTRSHKYHCLQCSSAKACTKNCMEIKVSEAIERGGVPCKRCGGTCRVVSPS